MAGPYRNSDFRVNTYFKRFLDQLEMARMSGLDVFLECSNPPSEEPPVVCCPSCEHESLVPKDVYDQIKGGFIYKPE